MGTQRASLSLGRWSLWLLLLGLVLPSACAQAPSYREAVLRAVDQLNERSSEANLYRLLELDPPPEQDVSWGGGWEGDLSPDILDHTVAIFTQAVPPVRKDSSPSCLAPTSSRKPSQTWVPCQPQASCLSLSALGRGALHTWLPALLGAPGMEGVTGSVRGVPAEASLQVSPCQGGLCQPGGSRYKGSPCRQP